MSEGMFEKASRLRIRFNNKKGNCNTEDLWSIPLTSINGLCLDGIAKELSREIKATAEESFVETKSSISTELELKLDIVKHVIKVKLEERDKRKNAVVVDAQKEKLDELIAEKNDESLKGKSVEELQKMRDDL